MSARCSLFFHSPMILFFFTKQSINPLIIIPTHLQTHKHTHTKKVFLILSFDGCLFTNCCSITKSNVSYVILTHKYTSFDLLHTIFPVVMILILMLEAAAVINNYNNISVYFSRFNFR